MVLARLEIATVVILPLAEAMAPLAQAWVAQGTMTPLVVQASVVLATMTTPVARVSAVLATVTTLALQVQGLTPPA